MRCGRFRRALLLGAAVVGLLLPNQVGWAQTQAALPETVILAARMRLRAAETFKPNFSFSCLELIQRSERRSKFSSFHNVDSLLLEVATVDGRELFSWPGERRFTEQPPKELVAAGLTSTGEFLANVKNVLLSNNASLFYVGEDEIHRTRTLQYRFSLSQLVSGYRIFGQNQSAIVATSANIWANSETLELVRLELRTGGIPAELGIDSVTSRTDFARSTFGKQRVLLPDTATVTFAETNGRESRNEISFSHFRRYSSESSISYSSEGGSQGEVTSQVSQREAYLPGGLTIHLRLTTPINVGSARIGDPIAAVLTSDVKQKSRVLLPKGAVALGRVRLAEFLRQPTPYFIVGLEFTSVQVGLRDTPVWAYLGSYESLPTIESGVRRETTRALSLMNRGRLEITEIETTSPLHLPGVGTFVFTDDSAILPGGFEMDWISVKPAADARVHTRPNRTKPVQVGR